MEKSDVLISKSISHVSREIVEPQPKLNLLGQTTISPFIQNFDNRYRELYWLGDYLQSIISYTSLNTQKLSLKLIFSSQEVLIFQNEVPIIVYCLQKIAITSEELALKTESYKLQDVDCRWFFSGKAENQTSYVWACKQFGKYCFLERQDNSDDVNGYEWSRYDSVPFPIDFQKDHVIIKRALDNHRS